MKNEIKPGDLWLFGPKAQAEVLIVTDFCEDNKSVYAVSVTKELEMAVSTDMLVPLSELPDHIVLGELGCVVETREFIISMDKLYDHIGEVSSELLAKIYTLLSWRDGYEEVKRKFLSITLLGGSVAEEWMFIDPVTGEELRILTGQKIDGEHDSRYQELCCRVDYLQQLIRC